MTNKKLNELEELEELTPETLFYAVEAGADWRVTWALILEQLPAPSLGQDLEALEQGGGERGFGTVNLQTFGVSDGAYGKAEFSITIGQGNNVEETANNAIAIGQFGAIEGSSASAVALGNSPYIVDSPNSFASGNLAQISSSPFAVVSGNLAQASNAPRSVVTGNTASAVGSWRATATGEGANASNSDDATTYGAFASVVNSPAGVSVGFQANVLDATRGVAMGAFAFASHFRSVALGADSETQRANSVNVGDRDLELGFNGRQIILYEQGNSDPEDPNFLGVNALKQLTLNGVPIGGGGGDLGPDLEALDQTGGARGANAINLQTGRTSENAVARADFSLTYGFNARITDPDAEAAMAGGRSAEVRSGLGAMAWGDNAYAEGDYAASYGWFADASGDGAVAIGPASYCFGPDTTAVGSGATVNGHVNGAAFGSNSQTQRDNSVSFGDRDLETTGDGRGWYGRSPDGTTYRLTFTDEAGLAVNGVPIGGGGGSQSALLLQGNAAARLDDLPEVEALTGLEYLYVTEPDGEELTDAQTSVQSVAAYVLGNGIRRPENIDPADGATGEDTQPTLTATPYANIFSNDPRDVREFEVDFSNGDFSSPVYTGSEDSDTHGVAVGLAGGVMYKWRCRDISQDGVVSQWSVPTGFETANSGLGPGPTTLIGGDMLAGYFGTVSSEDLFTTAELSTAVGLSAGTVNVTAPTWHKFAWQGRVLFVPAGTLRNSLTWQQIYQAGLVYGTDDNGFAPSGTPVNQLTTVQQGGFEYIVRLPKGVAGDETVSPTSWLCAENEGAGSEWNELVYFIMAEVASCEDEPTWNRHGGPRAGAPWVELGVEQFFSPNGGESFCQETNGVTNRIARGQYNTNTPARSPAYLVSAGPTTSNAARGWRPVLELIPPEA